MIQSENQNCELGEISLIWRGTTMTTPQCDDYSDIRMLETPKDQDLQSCQGSCLPPLELIQL